jgi:hypothetical protein
MREREKSEGNERGEEKEKKKMRRKGVSYCESLESNFRL